MRIYALLSRLPWPKSYLGKIWLVAFIGTHVPMIVFLVSALFVTLGSSEAFWTVIVTILAGTLVATVCTLAMLYFLLEPVRRASGAMRDYLEQGRLPHLPGDYRDEAGVLMADTQHIVGHLDRLWRGLDSANRTLGGGGKERQGPAPA